MRKIDLLLILAVLNAFTVLYSSNQAFAGCTKDTDCKGDRICTKGECVNPEPAKAGSANQAEKMPAPGGPCKSYKNWLRVVNPGFTCVTSKGVTFKLIVRTDSGAEYPGRCVLNILISNTATIGKMIKAA